jgi:hypothetical protein
MGWLYQRDPVDNPVAYLTAKYNYDCDTHIAGPRRRPRRQKRLLGFLLSC